MLTLFTSDGRPYGKPFAGEGGKEYEQRLGLQNCSIYPRHCCGKTMTPHVADPKRTLAWCLGCGTLDLEYKWKPVIAGLT